jgi:hypothetical protein
MKTRNLIPLGFFGVVLEELEELAVLEELL